MESFETIYLCELTSVERPAWDRDKDYVLIPDSLITSISSMSMIFHDHRLDLRSHPPSDYMLVANVDID